MKRRAGARPEAQRRSEMPEPPAMLGPEALDQWIDGFMADSKPMDSIQDSPPTADRSTESHSNADSGSMARTARALSALPAMDPDRQAAMRAALEARFSLTVGSPRSSDARASADAGPMPSRLDGLARRLGLSAGNLRLLFLLLTLLALAGLFLQRGNPERAPASETELGPALSRDAIDTEADSAAPEASSQLQPVAGSASPAGTSRNSDLSAASPASTVEISAAASQSIHRTPEVQAQAADEDAPDLPAIALLHATAPPWPASKVGRAATERFSLSGYVRDAEGRGIADAIVTAWRIGDAGFFVQRSEADGSYRLELRAGQYRLHAEAQGFAENWYDGLGGSQQRDGARTVVVPAVDNNPVDFVLPQEGGR